MENSNKGTIRQWAEDDRPREKLALKGKSSLSNAELIAILIGSGNTKMSAVELAQSILKDVDNNLIELSKLGIEGLQQYKGIGAAKAISVIAALELGKRRNASNILERRKIKSSRDAYDLFFPYLSDRYDEEFRVLLLDRANKVIQNELIGEGGFSGTVADPKKIFKKALAVNASAIILGHNHPSDSLKPSQNDIDLTKKIKKAGDVLEISVLDHIIVGNDNYFSFADESMI